MKERLVFPKLPDKYEKFVRRFCGSDWRVASQIDCDGGLGVAIGKAILDGVSSSLPEIARQLGVDPDFLSAPYERLSINGYMKDGRIQTDLGLKREDKHAWGYLAGIAGGATGLGS